MLLRDLTTDLEEDVRSSSLSPLVILIVDAYKVSAAVVKEVVLLGKNVQNTHVRTPSRLGFISWSV